MPKTGRIASIATLAALLLAASAPEARAQTPTGIRSCVITALPVVFGVFTNAAPVATTGTITATCQGNGNNQTITTALSTGVQNAFLPRHMTNVGAPGRSLACNLFIDPAHTRVWGNGQGSTQLNVSVFDFRFIGTAEVTMTVYGQIPRQSPAPAPGVYADAILVTVVF